MLDKKRDYATVHGLSGIKFEQDGKYFGPDGAEIVGYKPMTFFIESKIEEPEIDFSLEPPQEVFKAKIPDGAEQFECPVCWRIFTKKRALAMHQRIHKYPAGGE